MNESSDCHCAQKETSAHTLHQGNAADHFRRRPLLLMLVSVVFAAVAAFCLIYVSNVWIGSLAVITLIVVVVYVETGPHGRPERSSQQVRTSPFPLAMVTFVGGTPAPLRALRAAFFVLAGVMVLFGISPLTERTAKTGMIASVIGLVTIGFANAALERHYVHTGRGQDVSVGSPTARDPDSAFDSRRAG